MTMARGSHQVLHGHATRFCHRSQPGDMRGRDHAGIMTMARPRRTLSLESAHWAATTELPSRSALSGWLSLTNRRLTQLIQLLEPVSQLALHFGRLVRRFAKPILHNRRVAVSTRGVAFGRCRTSHRLAIQQFDRNSLRAADEAYAHARSHRGRLLGELDALPLELGGDRVDP